MSTVKRYAIITGKDITNWLNQFKKATKNNKYSRIDYKSWQNLVRLSTYSKVNIKIDCDACEIKLYRVYFALPDSDKTFLCFSQDSGFLKFLEDKLYSSEEDNILNLNWKRCDIPTNCDYITTKDLNNLSGGTFTYTPSVNTINQYATASSASNVYTYDYRTEFSDMQKTLDELSKTLRDHIKYEEEPTNGEDTNMNTNDMFNFDFGVISDSKIRMSMYGYAIPNEAGKYVAYDVEHNRIMDVQILNFNCAGIFYKIPKPLNKITIGDVVFHNGVPMFVRDIANDCTRFTVIDPKEGTEKTILPAHSPFGFDYLTCLVSLMDSFDMPANENNPFGNMLPLLLMNNGQTSDQTLPLYLMMNGEGSLEWSNPYMLMAISNSNMDMNNPLMMMAMMKMMNKE